MIRSSHLSVTISLICTLSLIMILSFPSRTHAACYLGFIGTTCSTPAAAPIPKVQVSYLPNGDKKEVKQITDQYGNIVGTKTTIYPATPSIRYYSEDLGPYVRIADSPPAAAATPATNAYSGIRGDYSGVQYTGGYQDSAVTSATTPQASTYNVERDEAYEVAQLQDFELEGVGFLGAKDGVKTKANIVPKSTTLTPLQKYQAQFVLNDTEFERIGKSCSADDTGVGQERCMINTIASYRGGVPLTSDVVRVQNYVYSQPGPAQTTAVGSAPAYVSPYDNPSDPRGFQAYMDNCDRKYADDIYSANTCKEPILREMGITGPAQFYAPTLAPISSDVANPSGRDNWDLFGTKPSMITSAQPCSRRAGNGECLDEPNRATPTGWGWFDKYILRIPDTNRSVSVPVADQYGGVTYRNVDTDAQTVYTYGQYPVTDSSGQNTNMYTVAQENPSTGPFVNPFAGAWGTITGWFNAGGNKVTVPETQYQKNQYNDDYGYTIPYLGTPYTKAQYGTFVGPDSYCADEDCSVLINYMNEQPGSYGYDSDINYSSVYIPPVEPALEPYLPEDTGMDPPGWSVNVYDSETDSWSPEAPAGSGGWWNLWNLFNYAPPTRQFSTAVPFSGEMFERSLAASAFGAFLSKNEKKNIPARDTREPFGNGL